MYDMGVGMGVLLELFNLGFLEGDWEWCLALSVIVLLCIAMFMFYFVLIDSILATCYIYLEQSTIRF